MTNKGKAMKLNCSGRHKCGHTACYHHASNHQHDPLCEGWVYCPEVQEKVRCQDLENLSNRGRPNKHGTRRARRRVA